MATHAWRVELFLFVPQLDDEHREIVRRSGDLCAALTGGRPKHEINILLAGFIDSVRRHFASEEELMRATGYPGYAGHRSEHQRLMAQLFSLAEGFASGAIDDASEALARLVGSWSEDHIRVADSHFARFLHGTGRKKEVRCSGAAANGTC